MERKKGDHIRFRVMPWFFQDDGEVYKGTITGVVETKNGPYYHVDAMIGTEHVPDAIVLEDEIVKQ